MGLKEARVAELGCFFRMTLLDAALDATLDVLFNDPSPVEQLSTLIVNDDTAHTPNELHTFFAETMPTEEALRATAIAVQTRRVPVFMSNDFVGGFPETHVAAVISPPTVPFRTKPRDGDVVLVTTDDEDADVVVVVSSYADIVSLKLPLFYTCNWNGGNPVYVPRPSTQLRYGYLRRIGTGEHRGNLVVAAKNLIEWIPPISSEMRLEDATGPTRRAFSETARLFFHAQPDDVDKHNTLLHNTISALLCVMLVACDTGSVDQEHHEVTAFVSTPMHIGDVVTISTNIREHSEWGRRIMRKLQTRDPHVFSATNIVRLPACSTPTPSGAFDEEGNIVLTKTHGKTFETFAIPANSLSAVHDGLFPKYNNDD